MDTILKLLEENGQLTAEQIAVMLGKTEEEVKAAIKQYEDTGVIIGYTTLIDWDKTDREYVSAIIELKVTPQRDKGFDRIAEKIYNYPEVTSVSLVSGGFDLLVTIEGKTLKDVAYFVANKLAPMEDVISTATHFVLKKYKDKGIVYGAPEVDERGNIL
ncbi:MAG: Lrp/AsnC family transcriptional regulator [Eubacteriales bacterium]|jgi:DNA-binding Lrp family transcriptional regulator|nr:Lrp/AsnC family transcriptional regulator [Clostridiales bacterium]